MTRLPNADRNSEELARRVIACLPAATFEMETLLRLARSTPPSRCRRRR